MSGSKRLTRAERELELALAAIPPKPTNIDRDRLLIRAGQLAVRRRLRFWMAAAAVLAVCACLSLALRPKPRTVERIVYVDRPTPTEAPEAPMETRTGVSYIEMRQAIADRNMDASAWDNDQGTTEPMTEEPEPPSLFLGWIRHIAPDQGDEQ